VQRGGVMTHAGPPFFIEASGLDESCLQEAEHVLRKDNSRIVDRSDAGFVAAVRRPAAGQALIEWCMTRGGHATFIGGQEHATLVESYCSSVRRQIINLQTELFSLQHFQQHMIFPSPDEVANKKRSLGCDEAETDTAAGGRNGWGLSLFSGLASLFSRPSNAPPAADAQPPKDTGGAPKSDEQASVAPCKQMRRITSPQAPPEGKMPAMQESGGAKLQAMQESGGAKPQVGDEVTAPRRIQRTPPSKPESNTVEELLEQSRLDALKAQQDILMRRLQREREVLERKQTAPKSRIHQDQDKDTDKNSDKEPPLVESRTSASEPGRSNLVNDPAADGDSLSESLDRKSNDAAEKLDVPQTAKKSDARKLSSTRGRADSTRAEAQNVEADVARHRKEPQEHPTGKRHHGSAKGSGRSSRGKGRDALPAPKQDDHRPGNPHSSSGGNMADSSRAANRERLSTRANHPRERPDADRHNDRRNHSNDGGGHKNASSHGTNQTARTSGKFDGSSSRREDKYHDRVGEKRYDRDDRRDERESNSWTDRDTERDRRGGDRRNPSSKNHSTSKGHDRRQAHEPSRDSRTPRETSHDRRLTREPGPDGRPHGLSQGDRPSGESGRPTESSRQTKEASRDSRAPCEPSHDRPSSESGRPTESSRQTKARETSHDRRLTREPGLDRRPHGLSQGDRPSGESGRPTESSQTKEASRDSRTPYEPSHDHPSSESGRPTESSRQTNNASHERRMPREPSHDRRLTRESGPDRGGHGHGEPGHQMEANRQTNEASRDGGPIGETKHDLHSGHEPSRGIFRRREQNTVFADKDREVSRKATARREEGNQRMPAEAQPHKDFHSTETSDEVRGTGANLANKAQEQPKSETDKGCNTQGAGEGQSDACSAINSHTVLITGNVMRRGQRSRSPEYNDYDALLKSKRRRSRLTLD
ncbi:hypothetical protein DIPPA_03001, partial [Diplonema papillatum]